MSPDIQSDNCAATDMALSVAIVGVDTFIGSHLASAFAQNGHHVFGTGAAPRMNAPAIAQYQQTDFTQFHLPDDCTLVLFCHDVSLRATEHIPALQALCAFLTQRHAAGHVRICYFSSINICDAIGRGTITENAAIQAHNQRETIIAEAEQCLRTWSRLSNNIIIPHVFRHGELYGEPTPYDTKTGFLNATLHQARARNSIDQRGLGTQFHTLMHVKDFANAVVALIATTALPAVVNIPGERVAVVDYMNAISNHFGVELTINAQNHGDNLSDYAGDRVLSARRFKKQVDFTPAYRFKRWLKAQ